MSAHQYPFIDVAVHERVRLPFARGEAVVLFSTDRHHWGRAPRRLTGLVRLDSQARYRVVGLPPGTYHLAAVTDAEPQALTDPGFLEQLAAQSITITLGEGEQKTQDLRLAGA